MFACLSNLKQSCSKFNKEQTLFRSHLMKMCTTCSKKSHKSEVKVDSTSENFSKYWLQFQFHDLDFGMILLSIRCELDYDPLIEIVAGMWVYNFRVDCIR